MLNTKPKKYNFLSVHKKSLSVLTQKDTYDRTIDCLFKNTNQGFNSLSILESDMCIAMKNLRKLINELQKNTK